MKPVPPPGFTVFEIDPDLPLPPEVPPWTSRVLLVEETSLPDRLRPWITGTGAVILVACAVLLAFGKPWWIPVLPAALVAIYAGLRGPDRSICAIASPHGRFVLIDDIPDPPREDPGEVGRVVRMIRLASRPAVSIPFSIALAALFAYLLGSGGWLPALGLFLFFLTCWKVTDKLLALVNVRSIEAPASARFLALADPRHPLASGLAPEADGTPRSAIEALRSVGREWTHEEYREVRRAIGRGITEDEACRRVRGNELFEEKPNKE
jgi:hypothetical protein